METTEKISIKEVTAQIRAASECMKKYETEHEALVRQFRDIGLGFANLAKTSIYASFACSDILFVAQERPKSIGGSVSDMYGSINSLSPLIIDEFISEKVLSVKSYRIEELYDLTHPDKHLFGTKQKKVRGSNNRKKTKYRRKK